VVIGLRRPAPVTNDTAGRIVPTLGQLTEAFEVCRLTSWPEDLDDALANPVTSRLIHLHAIRLVLGHDASSARTVRRPAVEAPEPPHPIHHAPAARPRRTVPPIPTHPVPLVDRKRAAGGDED
jgi:hypothetical protein